MINYKKSLTIFFIFCKIKWLFKSNAGVAELADALDLGSSGVIRAGSIPVTRISTFEENVVEVSDTM